MVRVPTRSRRDEDDFDDDNDDYDRRGRKRRRSEKAGFNGLWMGLAACGVVVLVGSCCLIGFISNRREGRGPQANFADRVAPQPVQAINPKWGGALPDWKPDVEIQEGIQFQEVTLRTGAVPMKVWFYRPKQFAGKLPLILVPPAGSTLFVGMDLGDGDRSEHFPYARAGFAVGSFEIDGHVPNLDNARFPVLLQGAREFRNAQAGLTNAKAALDYILVKSPEVDPNRIYIAGHSSAATLALLVAQHEPRIKACVAYAPVTDVEDRLAQVMAQFEPSIPGFRQFIHSSSPLTHADKLKCPVFLFHAQDDNNVPVSQSISFAALVKNTNPQVTLVTVPQGGHYDSMIREGIPRGIAWLQKF